MNKELIILIKKSEWFIYIPFYTIYSIMCHMVLHLFCYLAAESREKRSLIGQMNLNVQAKQQYGARNSIKPKQLMTEGDCCHYFRVKQLQINFSVNFQHCIISLLKQCNLSVLSSVELKCSLGVHRFDLRQRNHLFAWFALCHNV